MRELKYPKYLEKGMEFGRLTVIGVDESSKVRDGRNITPSHWKYTCQCSCDNTAIVKVTKYDLVSAHTQSCGCYAKERVSESKSKTNPIENCGDYIKIFFFNSDEYIIIDTEDYDKVKEHCWTSVKSRNTKYAQTYPKDQSCTRSIKIHQIILPTEEGIIADHINGNGLDNRKSNLRPATQSQNNMNRELQSNNTSDYMGVSWCKSKGVWRARIKLNNKEKHLGYYPNKEDAIKARKEAEERHFGKYSYDNSRNKEK